MIILIDILSGALIVIGAGFCVLAGLGLVRFPDVYTRMHAASKAGTLGAGLSLLGLAIEVGEVGVATRAIAGFVFLLLTAPISAHLLARAAYIVGVEPASETRIDELGSDHKKASSREASR